MKENQAKETLKIPRIHIDGGLYYATSRGDNNEDIFKDSRDYDAYLELLKKYKEQYGFKLFSFVLMPNHLHLLMELKEGVTISQIMHDLNANYTKYFNGRYERKGHLFQERYKMVLLEKAQYLLAVSAYIHLNPQVLGLAVSTDEYIYSSYPVFTGLITADMSRVDMRAEVIEMSQQLSGRKYEEALNAISKAEMEVLGKDLSKKTIMGGEEFIQKVRDYSEKSRASQPVAAVPASEDGAHPYRRLVLAGVAAAVILGVLSIYLFAMGMQIRDRYNKELALKDAQISARLAKEKEFIHKDLEEKYQADMISYKAMAKRLELEKKKVQTLEDKLDKGGVKQ